MHEVAILNTTASNIQPACQSPTSAITCHIRADGKQLVLMYTVHIATRCAHRCKDVHVEGALAHVLKTCKTHN